MYCKKSVDKTKLLFECYNCELFSTSNQKNCACLHYRNMYSNFCYFESKLLFKVDLNQTSHSNVAKCGN